MFTLLHPTESYVSFTAIDGSRHEIGPESSEQFFEGNLLPNGNLSITQYFILMKIKNWSYIALLKI